MKIPNLRLMREYGNEGVFFAKTAHDPMEGRHALLSEIRAHMEHLSELRSMSQQLAAQEMNARSRLQELAKMESTISNASHTRAPILISGRSANAERDATPSAADIPVGYTEGMVRLASAIGQDMAKMAQDPYRTPSPEPVAAPVAAAAEQGAKKTKSFLDKTGLKGRTFGVRNAIWKPAALGAAGLATYGGLKLLKGGLNWASQEPSTATYNAGGNQLAQDVNEYGQAQRRLPAYYY